MSDEFLTISHHGESLFKDRGSRFIGLSFHIETTVQVERILSDLRNQYHDARHHCFAYILDPDAETFKVNDDGEPAHSAGDPILGQIKSRGLTQTLVVVIRYFGGTKLGVGGLIYAYKTAASDALDNSRIIKKYLYQEYSVSFQYDFTSQVQRILSEMNLKPKTENYTEICELIIPVRLSLKEMWEGKLREALERGWIVDFSSSRS